MRIITFLFLLISSLVWTQDAYHIRSFHFEGNKESAFPVFKLGDNIRFSFDDLLGTEIDYYYRITQYTKDWKPSSLRHSEYIQGSEKVLLRNLSNSFNTLQMYTHYRESIPNTYQRILLSGNYQLEILNADDEVVLSRKFVVYEDMVNVAIEAKRTRDLNISHRMQNLYV